MSAAVTRSMAWFLSLNGSEQHKLRNLARLVDPESLTITFYDPIPDGLPDELEPEQIAQATAPPSIPVLAKPMTDSEIEQMRAELDEQSQVQENQ